MGLGLSLPDDPASIAAAMKRQTVLVIWCIFMMLTAGVVIGLSLWQVSNEGSSGGPGTPINCEGLRPSSYTVNGVTSTCQWYVANSAVRILAACLTVFVFSIILAKIGWYRTDRKIWFIILLSIVWIGATGWLVIAGWDANGKKRIVIDFFLKFKFFFLYRFENF